MDENTELRIILEHYFNDTHFTECLLNDNCTETEGSGNDTTLSTAASGLAPSPLPQYFFILVILIYILIFLAGVIGNSLVIFVVTRFPGLHTVTNTYILNLAIADMCFLLGKSSSFSQYFDSKKRNQFEMKSTGMNSKQMRPAANDEHV